MSTLYNWIFDQDLDMKQTIISTQNIDYTYLDFLNEIEEYSALLEPLHLKNKKIALIVGSVPSFLGLTLAVSKLGGISIPISPQLRNEDLLGVLDFTDPHIVFTSQRNNGFPLSESVHEWAMESQRESVIFDSDNDVNWNMSVYEGVKRDLEFTNIQVIGCTSGSTGTPKGIVADLEFFKVNDERYRVVSNVSLEDRIFLMAPASGLFGMCWLLSSMHSQYPIVTTESFSFPDIIQLLEQKPTNKLVSTPSLFRALHIFSKSLRSLCLERLSLVSLAGEAITEDFLVAMSDVKSKINSFYGFSELGSMMFTQNDVREGLKWSLLPNVQHKLAIEVNDQEIGEILFKAGHPFLGYYRRKDLSDEVYVNGWYHSGDLAKVNQNGEIEIIGRKKNMIKKGGQQVIPEEIEQCLGQHEGVEKAVIVGIPHSVYGEQIIAFVVKGKDVVKPEIYNYLENRIARYKIPDQIHFIEEIPITNSKIDKVLLRQMAMKRNETSY